MKLASSSLTMMASSLTGLTVRDLTRLLAVTTSGAVILFGVMGSASAFPSTEKSTSENASSSDSERPV